MEPRSCIDCPKIFQPKAARQLRCKKCAAEKIRADDRERKRVKPAPVAPAMPVSTAPIVVENVGRIEPDISEDALSLLDESHQIARLRAHRTWKESKFGSAVKTATPVRAPEVQMDALELSHIASEPNIHEAGLTPSERSKRLTQHRAWEDRSTKSSVGNLDYLFASKKIEIPLDPFLQEIKNTDAEHLTVFQTPNGALYDRMPNGNVRESKLKFMRGLWFSKVAMDWEPLYEGSTVVVVKMAAPIPSLNAILEQKSTGEWEWVTPVTTVLNWGIAYLTQSKALYWPDGSPAHLRSRTTGENFDIYGRLVLVIEISDPPFADFIITDEGHYVRKSSWAARSYWVENLTARIRDIEKREVDKELYAPTLKAWREEVSLLANDHFTIPAEVAVEPPLESIKLPPIPEEPPQRPEPPARVDVLDRQTRNDIARSEMMADGLDVVADGGYGDVESTLRASMGYVDFISDLEHAKSSVISEKPESYRQQRRDIARAKRR